MAARKENAVLITGYPDFIKVETLIRIEWL